MQMIPHRGITVRTRSLRYAADWVWLGICSVRARIWNLRRVDAGAALVAVELADGISDRSILSQGMPRFAQVDSPLVSIVIPAYGHRERTIHCLHAVSAADTKCAFEVIVVDDGSPDDTAQVVGACTHVRLLRMQANKGFVHACNAGAALAQGSYVVFLNNDTEVSDGWLDALLDCFTRQPRCGLVGAKLIYPDRTLQEAGGIVFRDGNACNYGRGQAPDDPRFNFTRQVDYCSGACIALPTALFASLGGFDQRYVPAYYEDTDLAFAVRQAGYEVWYQPRARVLHVEGATAGTNVADGVKRFQEVNRVKFVDKWRDVLAYQPDVRDFQDDPQRCATRRSGARILVVDAHFPHPSRDSGSMRMQGMLKIMRRLGFHVAFWATAEAHRDVDACSLEDEGIELILAPSRKQALRWWRDFGAAFDLVMLSRLPVARRSMRLARRYAPQAPVIFDTVDLHFLRVSRGVDMEGSSDTRAQADQLRRLELDMVRQADLTLVVSDHECDLLRQAVPQAEVRLFSNVHNIGGRGEPFERRSGFLFLGNFEHAPNVDAVDYLCGEIMPRIRQVVPEAILHIVGYAGTEIVGSRARKDVIVHGHVEDLDPMLNSVRVALAPLRYGAGVKGKINLAMSHGVPVVTTSIGAEGMALVNRASAMIADGPDELAAAAIELYTSQTLWGALSDGGVANISRNFSEEVAERALHELLSVDIGLLPGVNH